MKETYRDRDGAAHEATVEEAGPHAARVRVGAFDAELSVTALGGGLFRMTDGTHTWLVRADRDGATRHVSILGAGSARFEREVKGRRRREKPAGSLSSPMPGTVVKVLVREGDRVEKGGELLLVEAMKMEIKIEAPLAGTVRAILKQAGDPCDAGETLVEITPDAAADDEDAASGGAGGAGAAA